MSVPSSNQQDADRVAEIRARWEAATPEPWEIDEGAPRYVFPARPKSVAVARANKDADAIAIASAPTDIAWLLAERDALRAQLQAVKDLHQPRDYEYDGYTITRCIGCDYRFPCPTVRAASAPGVGAAQTRTEDE